MSCVAEKVTALIVREAHRGRQPTEPSPGHGWAVSIDYHVFRPFWTPSADLFAMGAAMILKPQRQWIAPLGDAFDA